MVGIVPPMEPAIKITGRGRGQEGGVRGVRGLNQHTGVKPVHGACRHSCQHCPYLLHFGHVGGIGGLGVGGVGRCGKIGELSCRAPTVLVCWVGEGLALGRLVSGPIGAVSTGVGVAFAGFSWGAAFG